MSSMSHARSRPLGSRSSWLGWVGVRVGVRVRVRVRVGATLGSRSSWVGLGVRVRFGT